MAKRPASFSLSEKARKDLALICEHLNLDQTAALESAIEHLAHHLATGDEWVGTGEWYGWRISNSHELSGVFKCPLLICPRGYTTLPSQVDVISALQRYPPEDLHFFPEDLREH